MPHHFTVNILGYSCTITWKQALTFDNQDGRSGQALHISVNDADIFPSMVQLDVTNHQISWYTLEGNLIVEKMRLSKRCCVISSLSFWLWDVWNIYNALLNQIVSRPLIFASLQTPTTDMADVLCTNNAIGCPSGTTNPTNSYQLYTGHTKQT